MFKRIASLLIISLVAGCGGSGDAGTSVFGGGSGGTTPPTTTATAIDVVASALEVGSGGDQVIVTATVKGTGNVSLPDTAVAFATSSGTLASAMTKTDANGVATASLSAGADKSNRDITVTVTSGAAVGTIVLPVSGTTLTYSGPTTIALSAAASVSVKAVDSKGTSISGLAVAVASSLGNGLSATSIMTDSQGAATVTYTASKAGVDTLSFTGGGTAKATAQIQISAEDFQFVSPAAATSVVVGASQTLAVRYVSNGVAQVGKTILFTSTGGVVTPSAVTDSTGVASATISSTLAGPALVQATFTAAGVSAQASLPLTFIAQAPAKLVLQATPTAIGPNVGGGTAQQSQLLATVTDASGNVVSGATVNFTRLADPSAGSLSQASAVTNGSGQATVQYYAGALTTASNGVQLRATVSGSSTVFGDTTLTVNQSALFIALGTGNVIGNIDEQTYKKDWVAYVTDANGVAVPNISLTIKVLPLQYGKGALTWNGKSWEKSTPRAFDCANEDLNYNGILDAGEDANGSTTLEPGNVISVSTTGAAGGSSTGTVKTDGTGRATISLIYAESYAPWVQVKLRAEATVSGTESSKEAIFWVSGAASDFTSETNTPAGVSSPFGANACNVPN